MLILLNGVAMRRVIFILFCIAAVCLGTALNANAYDLAVNSDDTQDPDLLKPKIEYVIVDSITQDPSGYFNILHYTVRWRGHNELGVGVGEYYEGMLTLVVMMFYRDYSDYAFEENGVTYYEISRDTDIISPDCYAYIDFCVQNKWGMDEYEIELLPGGILSSTEMIEDEIEDFTGEETFEVYDCSGNRVGVFQNREDIRGNSPKGLLIIRRMRNNVVVSTEKLLNR